MLENTKVLYHLQLKVLKKNRFRVRKDYQKIDNIYFPLIVISRYSNVKKAFSGEFIEVLNIPFRIIDLEKKNSFFIIKI